MMESYFFHRPNLVGLILVADVRRSCADEEIMIRDLAQVKGISLLVALAKSDKLSHSQRLKSGAHWKQFFNEVQIVSSKTKDGVHEVKKWIELKLENKR